MIEDPDPEHRAHDPRHHVVEPRHRHLARLDGRLQGGGEVFPRRQVHLHVQAGVGCRHRRVRAPPVGHHEPVEAEILLEDRVQGERVLARVGAVDAVVGAHHRARAPLLDRRLIGGGVDLVQGPLVDIRGVGHAVYLLAVGHVVLDRGDHRVGLESLHLGGRALSGQERVLTHVLEVAPVDRQAVDLDARGELDVYALVPGLPAQRGAELALERGVPAGGLGDRRRERRRVDLVVSHSLAGVV